MLSDSWIITQKHFFRHGYNILPKQVYNGRVIVLRNHNNSSLQVLVKDHLDKPVNRVRVRLVERHLFRQGRDSEDMPCPESANSQSDGIAVFICNTPSEGIRAVLKVRRRRRRRMWFFTGVSTFMVDVLNLIALVGVIIVYMLWFTCF